MIICTASLRLVTIEHYNESQRKNVIGFILKRILTSYYAFRKKVFDILFFQFVHRIQCIAIL